MIITVGNQKVTEIVVLVCNGSAYSKACSYHFWKNRQKVSFGIFRSSAVAFDFMSSKIVGNISLRSIFRVGKIHKSLGGRSGDCGGWVMTGMSVSARNCSTTGDVWLGALPCCRNRSGVHATCHAASFELQRATCAKLVRRNYQ